jgi:hypothetical protein
VPCERFKLELCPGPAPLIGPTFLAFIGALHGWILGCDDQSFGIAVTCSRAIAALSVGGASTVLVWLGPGARGRLSVPLAVTTVGDHMMPLRDLASGCHCRATGPPVPRLSSPCSYAGRAGHARVSALCRGAACKHLASWATQPRAPTRRLAATQWHAARLLARPCHWHAPRRAPGTSLPLAVEAQF